MASTHSELWRPLFTVLVGFVLTYCGFSNAVSFSHKKLLWPMAANNLSITSQMSWALATTFCGDRRTHISSLWPPLNAVFFSHNKLWQPVPTAIVRNNSLGGVVGPQQQGKEMGSLFYLLTKWNRCHCPTFRGLYNADKECGYPINPKGYPHLPRVLSSSPVLQLDRGPVPVRERKVNVDAIHHSSSPAATLLSLCGVTFTNLCF